MRSTQPSAREPERTPGPLICYTNDLIAHGGLQVLGRLAIGWLAGSAGAKAGGDRARTPLVGARRTVRCGMDGNADRPGMAP